MRVSDFNMQRDLRLSFPAGLVTFHNSRQLILSAEALGTLRQILIRRFGEDTISPILMEFGWTCGYSDFLQVQSKYQFDSDWDLLASGPVLHSWEGIAKAVPLEHDFDRRTGRFYFRGTWTNSWEAEQHLCNHEASTKPVCSTLVGYASGWCSAFMGKLMVAVEESCTGMGEPCCQWVIRPFAEWNGVPEAYAARSVLQPLFQNFGG